MHLPIEHYTYEDYKHWEGKWELIYGVPYAMAPAPFSIHQILALRFGKILEEALEDCDRCFALMEEDWVIASDIVLKPDIMVACDIDLYANVKITPELIVEVISKSTARRDEELKFSIYEREGVKYYVLIYPDIFKAKVYELKNGKYQKVGDFEKGKTKFFIRDCEVEVEFEKVFNKVKRFLNG